MGNKFRHSAWRSDLPVDVCSKRLASLHCRLSIWELLHGSDLLFPVVLAVAIAEHPNIRAGIPLLAVQLA